LLCIDVHLMLEHLAAYLPLTQAEASVLWPYPCLLTCNSVDLQNVVIILLYGYMQALVAAIISAPGLLPRPPPLAAGGQQHGAAGAGSGDCAKQGQIDR
jgi:hypothetical protein